MPDGTPAAASTSKGARDVACLDGAGLQCPPRFVDYSTRCYTQPSSGDWHHLTVIYDKAAPGPTEITWFVDGVQTAPNQVNEHDNSNAFAVDALYLFARAGTVEFSAGEIDELRIFDRALTPAEVVEVFQAR